MSVCGIRIYIQECTALDTFRLLWHSMATKKIPTSHGDLTINMISNSSSCLCTLMQIPSHGEIAARRIAAGQLIVLQRLWQIFLNGLHSFLHPAQATSPHRMVPVETFVKEGLMQNMPCQHNPLPLYGQCPLDTGDMAGLAGSLKWVYRARSSRV